jgi:hypothetical protein
LRSLPEPKPSPEQNNQSEVVDSTQTPPLEWAASFKTSDNASVAPVTDPNNNRHDEGLDKQSAPHAKELIKKMEGISKTMVPDWCSDYSFSGLEELKRERAMLADQIRQTQGKISALETRIAVLDGIKNSLLAADGDDLVDACAKVFKRLSWNTENSQGNKEELWLGDGKKANLIARIVRSNSQPKNVDLAQLAQSIITYWGEHEVEPKGLMVASTWANRPPSERDEPDYSESLADFARKKNFCLMSTMQLLCIYRDLELGTITADEVKSKLTSTNGVLSGFGLEKTLASATKLPSGSQA